MSKTTELTLSDILKQDPMASIWVRNNVHRSPDVGREGDLVINIPKPNGVGSTVLRVERTWLPIDLTTQMSRLQILESAEFRSAVTNKFIVLLTEEYAQRLLRSPDAENEQRRLSAQREYIRTATGVQGITNDGTAGTVYGTGGQDEHTHQNIPTPGSDEEQDMFTSWLNSLEFKDDTQVLSELRTRRLNRKKARAILARLTEAKHPRSRSMLERSLTK